MNYSRIKRITSILLITMGAVALISEIASMKKNYYIQSMGLVFLMLGLFMINTKVKSKTDTLSDQDYKEEE